MWRWRWDERARFTLSAIWAEMPRSPGHVLLRQAATLLTEGGFDGFVQTTPRRFCYALDGAPSLPPGCHFRMHMVGYFKD